MIEDEPLFRRGVITGWQTGGPPLTEATRFVRCKFCGDFFDCLDLGAVLDHKEADGIHPASDLVQ